MDNVFLFGTLLIVGFVIGVATGLPLVYKYIQHKQGIAGTEEEVITVEKFEAEPVVDAGFEVELKTIGPLFVKLWKCIVQKEAMLGSKLEKHYRRFVVRGVELNEHPKDDKYNCTSCTEAFAMDYLSEQSLILHAMPLDYCEDFLKYVTRDVFERLGIDRTMYPSRWFILSYKDIDTRIVGVRMRTANVCIDYIA
jgi:hypothetical protein